MAHRLPEFKGYTVDRRLREFRRMIFGEPPEFISFDCVKGRELKAEMRKRPCRFCHHQKGRDEHKASGNGDCRCSCNH